MTLVDAHAHLHAGRLKPDLPAVVDRARSAGVGAILTNGTDVASSEESIVLAERFPSVYAAVGIHPNDTAKARDGDIDRLRELARHPKVVAIGEIGLDFYRDWSPFDVQHRLFDELLDLATACDLPVCIHARDSLDAVLDALGRWRVRGMPSRPGMLHCFSGTAHQAADAVALGMYISVAGPITYPKNDGLVDAVRSVALNRLLTETDCPYLAPQRQRGKRNEPALMTAVAETIAAIHGRSVDDVIATTGANARTLFGIPA